MREKFTRSRQHVSRYDSIFECRVSYFRQNFQHQNKRGQKLWKIPGRGWLKKIPITSRLRPDRYRSVPIGPDPSPIHPDRVIFIPITSRSHPDHIPIESRLIIAITYRSHPVYIPITYRSVPIGTRSGPITSRSVPISPDWPQSGTNWDRSVCNRYVNGIGSVCNRDD